MKTLTTTTTTAAAATLFAALCVGPLAGCDVEPEATDSDGAGEIDFRYCPTCIGNSPMVNGSLVRELSLSGAPNVDGVAIVKATGSTYEELTLDVDPSTSSLVATNGLGGLYSGTDLVGVDIGVSTAEGDFILRVSEVDTLPTWSDAGNDEYIYRIIYLDEGTNTTRSLCETSDPDGDWLTILPHEIVIPGPTDVVTEDQDWFTLACVGEAAFKMKMLGYSRYSPTNPNVNERVATIRMITADYCGTGISFTAPGVEVAWADLMGVVTPPFAEVSMEAKWDESGAQCLNIPRYASMETVLDECSIPECKDEDLDTPWRTMLPW